MDLDQKITWKRGQLSVRDSFSYLPEGNFGGAYGSTGLAGNRRRWGAVRSPAFWGGTAWEHLGLRRAF